MGTEEDEDKLESTDPSVSVCPASSKPWRVTPASFRLLSLVRIPLLASSNPELLRERDLG